MNAKSCHRFWHCTLTLSVLAICLVPAWAGKGPKPAPSLILVTIDTLRADHLGCYGATAVQTPALDDLAHDSVVFDRAISQVPLTWPSHAAILTGTYPFQNGVQDFTGQPLASQFQSIAQALKRQGYATGAVVSAYVLDRSWGLDRGFDFYDDAFSAETFQKKDIGLVDRRAGDSVNRAIAWLERTPRRPFFLWLHLYDPHSPYDPPEPYRTQYRGHLYDGEIAYTDFELGRLITWLKRHQLYDSSAVVVLSDHGESLGEHGEQEHGFFVYNSTVHIPLIVKPPAGSRIRPARISRPVETVSVAPTLLRLARARDEIEKQFSGFDLLEPSPADTAAYSETFYPFSSFGWSPLHALETERYHFIDAPAPELYDLSADPGEQKNLAADQTATVAVLKEKLAARLRERPFTSSSDISSSLSPEAQDKLRALGYVAFRSPVSSAALATGLADPKDKLWEFNAILQAGDAFHVGDYPAGEALLAKVQEKDPKLYIVPFMLGENALRRQDWAAAATQLRQCLALNPNFDQAMTGLARALANQENAGEARQWLEKALQFNPRNYRAWYELGYLEAKADRKAAIQDYEKALAIQQNFAPLRRDLGMAYFQEQNYAEAAKNLAKAAELGVQDAQLYNFLGIAYSHTGRPQRAVDAYRQALKLNPNLAEAHLNLAYAYQQQGQVEPSQKEYEAACNLEPKFCQFAPAAPKK